MQGNMAIASKKRASKQAYQSLTQLTIQGFETPFAQKLDPTNRWVRLAEQVPWDKIVGVYLKQLNNQTLGASSINPRVVLGSVMIKHLKNLSDEETILEIQENMYLQYFIGYSSFTNEPAFDPSLFVEIRKRLGSAEMGQINDEIVSLFHQNQLSKPINEGNEKDREDIDNEQVVDKQTDVEGHPDQENTAVSHSGRLLVDATACPQDIAYPTDLNLLNDARMKSEELIDLLYQPGMEKSKPRTYRKQARKNYLRFAKSKQRKRK